MTWNTVISVDDMRRISRYCGTVTLEIWIFNEAELMNMQVAEVKYLRCRQVTRLKICRHEEICAVEIIANGRLMYGH